MAEADVYLLGRSHAEEERLRQQAEELAAEARSLLDQLGIRKGQRAIEVGCGPCGMLALLSERVGPDGAVVGLERSEQFVASARKFVTDRRLTNVEVRQGDARATGLPRESFDGVFERLVLVNVPEPAAIVTEMVALARPGGVVASYEADYLPHLCDPPSHAWDRLFEVFQAYSNARGIDLFVGRRTHRMLRDAGLVDLLVRPVINVYPPGNPRRTIFRDFMTNLRADVVADGLVGEAEIARLIDDLRNDLDDPHRLVLSHLFIQVWGRKPERQAAA